MTDGQTKIYVLIRQYYYVYLTSLQVVQVYISWMKVPIPAPMRQLVGTQRVSIPSGKMTKVRVSFISQITRQSCGYICISFSNVRYPAMAIMDV